MPTWSPKPKRSPSGDFPDVDTDFSKLLELLIPDVFPSGWPRYRGGSSPRNWGQPGNYNYVDPGGFLQIGYLEVHFEVPTGEGQEYISLPVAHSGTPIVFVLAGPHSHNDLEFSSRIHYHVKGWRNAIDVWWDSWYTLDWLSFYWFSFGPGAG